MSALSPCPFCPDGGMPRFVSATEAKKPTSAVTCERCCTVGPPGITRVQAVERWNRRPMEGAALTRGAP
jgi:hypothetical protein